MGNIRRLPLVAALLFACGCICPYWISPAVTCVWPVPLPERDDTIRAFRVDTRETMILPDSPSLTPHHQLTPLALEPGGDIPAQVQLSCTRGFLAFFVALNYTTWHQDTISVRLYRPGYHTVDIAPWSFASQVRWTPAESVKEQCAAVDVLVGGNLEPGGASKQHRAALLFAAGEYRRLASLRPDIDGDTGRQKILAKAAELEKRAEEPCRFWLERLID